MNKIVSLLYSIACYLVFFFSFLYLIGFVGNLVVPKSIDSGTESSLSQSLTVNLVLLSWFAVQHTIMARPAFKRWWTKIVPTHVERSTYVLAGSLLLMLLCWQWRPMPSVIWNLENPIGKAIFVSLFWLGWSTSLFSSFIIDHFDLFGLRQVWLHFGNQKYHHVEFQMKSLYRYTRHPLMLGFLIAFWATPSMTLGHLLFASAMTIYILIGVRFEEHDLLQFIGKDYAEYRRRVPMLLPFTRK